VVFGKKLFRRRISAGAGDIRAFLQQRTREVCSTFDGNYLSDIAAEKARTTPRLES
jgi:hypothetical protein